MGTVEILMNPARQRIYQYLLAHDTATVKELRAALPDVPGASLYRHVKLLADEGILVVVRENRIRGTVESVYQVNRSALELGDGAGLVVQSALLGLCGQFADYFQGEVPDPVKDMLLVTGFRLNLTDGEFSDFLAEFNALAAKYMEKSASDSGKNRQLTLISAPPLSS